MYLARKGKKCYYRYVSFNNEVVETKNFLRSIGKGMKKEFDKTKNN